MNGLSAEAGLRCSRTFSAAFASAGMNGFASVKASYCIRPGCQRFSHSATCGVTDGLDHRLHECAVKRQIDFRDARGGRKTPLILRRIAAHGADIVQRPLLAAHDPLTRYQIGIGGVAGFALELRLIEAGRQYIDQIDIAGELIVLFLCNPAGDENPEMADRLMHGVDDGLAERPDLVDIVIEVENPVQRLLRRRDVVALRAEHHDRRANVAKVDGGAVRCLDAPRGQLVADEQLVDDELDFLGIEVDVPAPPALELEVARAPRCRPWSRRYIACSTACWPDSGSRSSAPASRRRICRRPCRW